MILPRRGYRARRTGPDPGGGLGAGADRGPAVVRVREATDGATKFVQAVLASAGNSVLVLEAAALLSRSRLRQLVEAAPNAASITCYCEEGRGLEQSIRTMLTSSGFRRAGDSDLAGGAASAQIAFPPDLKSRSSRSMPAMERLWIFRAR